MKNLKKTLAVVLAFAVVFSMGMINTFAYSDVEAGTVVEEAVGILSNLKILAGFEDGTFRPDETVTRAQMAKIICCTLGYAEQAESSAGTTAFNDVAGDHWAAGYINVAYAQGIIAGYGNGMFGPEDPVTYEQAVKMIVSALGYDLVANNKGGYPTGYLAVASSEGITKNANGKVGDPAKRSTVAILVYNSLEVRLMDQTSWSTNNEDEYKKTDDTILSKYLEVQKVEGVVTEVPMTSYAEGSKYDKDETPTCTIEGTYSYYYDGKKYDQTAEADDVDCSLVDVDSLLGKKVVAYIGEEEDEETGNKMVYAITEKQGKNKVTAIAGTQLVESSDKGWNVAYQVSYRNLGSSKVYDLDIAKDVIIYKNFDRINFLSETDVKPFSTKAFAYEVEDGGRIEFISNDNDEDIEVIMITAYNDESVIETVEEEEGIYTFELYNNGGLDEIDTEAEDELVVVYVDGELADVAAIEPECTVSTVEIGKDVRILYVSTKTVTGAVTSYSKADDEYEIAGEDYEVSPFFTDGKDGALKDEEGTFYLNVDGQIAYNESETASTGTYGVLIALSEETGINSGIVAQVALADGTVAEYDLTSKAKLLDEDGKTLADDDDAVFAALKGDMKSEKGVFKTKFENIKEAGFKFTFKNDEISKIRKTENGSTYANGNTKKYDADAMTYGSVEFDEDTVVFNIEHVDEEVIDDDMIKVGSVSSFFADGETGYAFTVADEKNSIAKMVIGVNLSTSIAQDSAVMVVNKVSETTYDDDDAYVVTGFQAGKEVSYTIYDKNADYTTDPEDLNKGDIILVADADAEGVANDCERLFDCDDWSLTQVAAKGDPKDDVYNCFAELNKKDTTSSKFYLYGDVTNTASTWAEAADGINMKSSANYTLVDYTESAKNPEMSKKNPGTSLFSTNSKYTTYVFVRVYDDALTDVVVYRFNNNAE